MKKLITILFILNSACSYGQISWRSWCDTLPANPTLHERLEWMKRNGVGTMSTPPPYTVRAYELVYNTHATTPIPNWTITKPTHNCTKEEHWVSGNGYMSICSGHDYKGYLTSSDTMYRGYTILPYYYDQYCCCHQRSQPITITETYPEIKYYLWEGMTLLIPTDRRPEEFETWGKWLGYLQRYPIRIHMHEKLEAMACKMGLNDGMEWKYSPTDRVYFLAAIPEYDKFSEYFSFQ